MKSASKKVIDFPSAALIQLYFDRGSLKRSRQDP